MLYHMLYGKTNVLHDMLYGKHTYIIYYATWKTDMLYEMLYRKTEMLYDMRNGQANISYNMLHG